DGALADLLEDGDGEHGDGDGGGDGEAGLERQVDGGGAEDDAEDGAEDDRLDGELGGRLGGGYVRAEARFVVVVRMRLSHHAGPRVKSVGSYHGRTGGRPV